MKQSHKRHHHVPETYLRPWSHRQTRRGFYLDAYNPQGSYLGEKFSLDPIFWEENFYAIYSRDGVRDLTWELWLGKLENAFSDARGRVLASGVVDPVLDLPVFKWFVSAQRHRSKAIFDRFKRNNEFSAEMDGKLGVKRPILLASGRFISVAEMEQFRGTVMTDMLLPEIRLFTRKIWGMAASLLTTTDSEGFWTCDTPVILGTVAPHTISREIESWDRRINLPLSPEVCLCLSWLRLPNIQMTQHDLSRHNQVMQKAAYKCFVKRRVPKTGASHPESNNITPE